ncbi:MAG: regulatory protein RecX [Arthrobacter sp.]|uniref:regulatory protein RecX n=1 Tax=Arthrobacter sp. TaxID=1667 RepID=UPI003498F80E
MATTPDWSGLTDAGDGTAGRVPDGTVDRDRVVDVGGPGGVDQGPDGSDPDGRRPARGHGGARGRGQRPGGRDGSGPARERDPESAARAIVLRQLTGAAKSRKQLEDKLRARDIPDPAARSVLDRFEELQLVDDAAFAQAWVRSRSQAKGLARGALRRELRDKGIDPELADAALEQLGADEEADAARRLAERRLRSVAPGTDRDRAVRRVVGMLARKGYPPGLAFRAASEAWDARTGDA